MPKSNINYVVLAGGTVPAESLITGLNNRNPYTTTISYGNYGEAARTAVPLRVFVGT